jgi:exosortase/archaeosortase
MLRRTNGKKIFSLLLFAAFIVCFMTGFILLSRKRSAVKIVRFLGIVGLLLVFEFIALLTHPWIEELTHHSPVWSLLLLVLLASVLVPAHHYFEKLIKEKLVHREINTL